MSRTLLALLAFVVGVALALAADSAAIKQVDVPNVGPVFVFTPEEMDKLEQVLTDLLGERDALKRRVQVLEKQCV